MSIKTALFAAALAVSAVAGAGAACAQTRWDQNHPRQSEVFHRDARQQREIRVDRRDGELTRGQAARLLRADHRVVREDRDFSRANGGYITKGQQLMLNRQENGVGRRLP